MIHRSTFIYRVFSILLWTVACFGFVAEELLPPLNALRSPAMLACDALALILGLLTMRQPRQLWVFASFIAITFASTIIANRLGTVTYANGSRMFFGILFMPPVVLYLLNSDKADRWRQGLDKQLRAFLYVQAACITWQFLRYGAGDHGGGSMGLGFSGITSTLIILISYYFVARDFDTDNFWASLWKKRQYIILVYPVFLNETKISFVFLAIYFVLLFRGGIRDMAKMVIALPFAAIVFALMYTVYMNVTGFDRDDDIDIANSDFINEYLFSEDADAAIENMQNLVDHGDEAMESVDGFSTQDLPRFVKIAVTPISVARSDGGTILGAGLGHFKGGTNLERTEFYKENEWLIKGTVNMYMFLYMQMGILGLLWMGFYIKELLRFGIRPYDESLRLKIFMLLISVISFFYNDSYSTLIFGLIFAIIAGMHSVNPVNETSDDANTDTKADSKIGANSIA